MSEKVLPVDVLIVDDNPEDRGAYRRFLGSSRDFEFSIHEAETVHDGLRAFDEIRPECILLDFRLPDGDGIEFLEALPEGRDENIEFVIFLTGQGDEELAVEALTKGAIDYLPKRRVDKDSLNFAIHSAHERATLRRQLKAEQAEKDRIIRELRQALEEVDRLSDLLPICAHCKNVRHDDGYWQNVETYFADHVGTKFSHGICPDCLQVHYGLDPDAKTQSGDGHSH